MEHETDVLQEGKVLLDDDPETRNSEGQVSSQDDNFLLDQAVLLHPSQRSPCADATRPWKSLPATPVGGLEKDQTVFFSSLTSLQAEEFFDMVAKVQARRLNDQRADFAGLEDPNEGNLVVSEDQLYDTILAHQSQRLEEQRTEPPIPVGIQGLLDLLLRAQGTRMEDQRCALPPALAAPSMLREHAFLPQAVCETASGPLL